jgi:hypothetical protein
VSANPQNSVFNWKKTLTNNSSCHRSSFPVSILVLSHNFTCYTAFSIRRISDESVIEYWLEHASKIQLSAWYKNRGHGKVQPLLNRICMTLTALIQGKSDAVMAQTTVQAIGYIKH